MTIEKLNINSLARLNYNSSSSSNFKINLGNSVNGKILSYNLKSATIPRTFYNINSPVNTLDFTDSTGNITITIPEGNYTITQFNTELQSQLNLTTDTYTVSYDQITGKINISSSFAGFTLIGGNIPVLNDGSIFNNPPNLNYMLGFDPTVTYVSVAGVLVAPGVPRLQGIENVYIRIDELTQYLRSGTNGYYNFEIPIDVNFNDIKYYTENNGFKQGYKLNNTQQNNIGYLTIQLLNIFNQPINLHGSDWNFLLEFEVE